MTPLDGTLVEVEGIVVGDFQDGSDKDLNGFFLQEETADEDSDPDTSEGIFVFDNNASPSVDVSLFQKVKVVGTVSEFFDKTQIVADTVEITDSGDFSADITVATVTLGSSLGTQQDSDADPDEFVPALEPYESMLVSFDQKLFVTEMFNLDRFNEIRVSEGDPRPYQFTQMNPPDDAGYLAHLQDVASRTVVYDDGRTTQNPPVDLFGSLFTTANFVRMGDSVTGMTGGKLLLCPACMIGLNSLPFGTNPQYWTTTLGPFVYTLSIAQTLLSRYVDIF